MINIQHNVSLLKYNTFGIDVHASQLVTIKSIDDFIEILPIIQTQKHLILGGGSNVLFTKDFDGLVIINELKGKEIKSTSSSKIIVEAFSGEIWHDFVLWTLSQNALGLENLSLIPGTVGAAPMQNIGAYGIEIKNSCLCVEAIEIATGLTRVFSNHECNFGYRESIFKRTLNHLFFITKVTFELNTIESHIIHSNYGAISEVLAYKPSNTWTSNDISNAVISIRTSKLPNPKDLGNAGSFFKNPILSKEQFEELKAFYPNMPFYPEASMVKIPAGWLIEQCGFKGKKVGNIGSHSTQSLVIVNYGRATGIEIYNYSQTIIDTILDRFGIVLEREVNIL